MFEFKITVFTPTFNRAHTLERLYKSLQNQSFTNFEWLVIDDGSIDDTSSLFKKWLKDNNEFQINYQFKNNGGKHTAINYALDRAKGELFFTADSDDYLTNDALIKVSSWADSLPKDQKFCGVAGNMGTSKFSTPNTIFKESYRDISILERYPEFSNQPVDGERVWAFFTDVHRNYKYPEYKGEKFMTEAVSWNRMAKDGYQMRVYNDIIYIYKFLPGGLTLSGGKLFIQNPKGYGLWLREKIEFCNFSYYLKLKIIYSYFISQKGKLAIKEISANIGSSLTLILFLDFLFSVKYKLSKP